MKQEDDRPQVGIASAERRFWRIQRISWVVMGAILVAALIGVFGGGPLSWGTRAVPSAAGELRYERILRLGQEGSLVWSGLRAATESIVIELDCDVERLSLLAETRPQPDRVTLTRNGMRFHFRTDRDSLAPIVMSISPRRPGFLTLRARVAEGPWMEIPFIVFPEE